MNLGSPFKTTNNNSNKYIPKKLISGYIHSFESPPVERATSIHDLHPISDLLIGSISKEYKKNAITITIIITLI